VPDYYDALGVGRDADPDEIKRAFRQLARDTHPDSNPDDPTAEQRFREVAEAYEVLSDPGRRAAYDRGDTADFSDLFSSFAGIDEVLSRFFGGAFGGFGAAPQGPARGSDVGVATSVTLAEAAAGAEREISFRTRVVCPTCQGRGAAPGTDLESCGACGGQGARRVTRQTILGTTMAIAPCEVCNGRGRVVVTPCSECHGGGGMADVVSVTIDIPAGIEDGARMRVPGRGSAGDPGGRSGDLYVEVSVAADPRFERHGPDLVHRVQVGIAEATLGTTVAIPTVDGDDIEIDVPPGTQPGAVFRLSKQGMPRLRRRGRGDLLVEVGVHILDRLDPEAEEALRSFAEASGESPAEPKVRRRHRR